MKYIYGLVDPRTRQIRYTHRVARQMNNTDWLLELGFWIMFFANMVAGITFIYEMGASWK